MPSKRDTMEATIIDIRTKDCKQQNNLDIEAKKEKQDQISATHFQFI